MELNLLERMKLLEVLPKEGNFLTLKIVRDLQSQLSPSEKEHKQYKIETRGNQVLWNEKGKEFKKMEIGDKAKEVIVGVLREMDKKGKLTFELCRVYEKYVDKEK